MGYTPSFKKSESISTVVRTGLLVGCSLGFLICACATAQAQVANPPRTMLAFNKAPSRKPVGVFNPDGVAPALARAGKPVEAKKPGASDEPDLPSRFAGQVFCPIPAEVTPGEELFIRCALKPGLGAQSVIVRYRVSGKEDYSTIDAIRSPKGWYVAKIKGNEIRGSSLQLYVEAYSPGNRVAGTSGSDDNPIVVMISGGVMSGPSADEDPLMKIQKEKEAEQMQSVEGNRRPSPSLWLGMGIGTGEGWYPKRTLERRSDASAKGWATGGWFHVLPEIGFNVTPNIAFSVQGRWQFVKNETEGNAPNPPHSRAYAVLGCLYLMTDSRTSDWQFFGTAAVGGGTAFRLYVASKRSAYEDYPNSDTVNGGPLVAGVGGGLIYHLTNFLALTGHVRSLAGFPKTAVVIEGGLGVQLALWPFSAYQSGKPSAAPQDLEPEPEYVPSEPTD